MDWKQYWRNNRLWRRAGSKILCIAKQGMMPDAKCIVVEVGCGMSRGGKYKDCWVGVDLEETVKPSIVAEASKLPFKDRSVALVYSFGLLEHLKEPLKALEEMRRVSGYVYFSVPCKDGLIDLLHRVYQKLDREWIFPKEKYYSPRDFPNAYRCRRVLRCEDLYVCD